VISPDLAILTGLDGLPEPLPIFSIFWTYNAITIAIWNKELST
jgi:hypothetical protein